MVLALVSGIPLELLGDLEKFPRNLGEPPLAVRGARMLRHVVGLTGQSAQSLSNDDGHRDDLLIQRCVEIQSFIGGGRRDSISTIGLRVAPAIISASLKPRASVQVPHSSSR